MEPCGCLDHPPQDRVQPLHVWPHVAGILERLVVGELLTDGGGQERPLGLEVVLQEATGLLGHLLDVFLYRCQVGVDVSV